MPKMSKKKSNVPSGTVHFTQSTTLNASEIPFTCVKGISDNALSAKLAKVVEKERPGSRLVEVNRSSSTGGVLVLVGG